MWNLQAQWAFGVVGKTQQHRELEQNFSFRRIPSADSRVSVADGFFVVGVPFDVEVATLVGPGELAGTLLQRFAELDAAQFSSLLLGSVGRDVDDVVAGCVDECGATGETTSEDGELEIPFHLLGREAREHCDVRTKDIVLPFVLRLDFKNGFVPDGSEEVEKPFGVNCDELHQLSCEYGVLVVFNLPGVMGEELLSGELLVPH